MNATMSETTANGDRQSARARLLAAANELFYAEGVHTVGIDRVIERAGVAKASLYNAFGSKDELIRAYLQARHAFIRDRMLRALESRYETPRERLLGIFEIRGEAFAEPGFRGCAFINARAEAAPGSPIGAAADDFRAWLRSLVLDLAWDAGARDPETLAKQLLLLYDGAGVSAQMDHDRGAAVRARAVAQMLVDAAIPA
jgi:AcrR family transcriptional regulator